MRQPLPPQSQFKSCLSCVHVPQKLLDGVPVLKVNSNGRTTQAFITLSQDRFSICVTASKFKNGSSSSLGLGVLKPLVRRVTSIGSHASDDDSNPENEGSIDVGSIERIQKGQNTLRFELARKLAPKIQSPRKTGGSVCSSSASVLVASTTSITEVSDFFDCDRSFSIMFCGQNTLDLIVLEEENDISRDEVVDVLHNLIETYTNAKIKVGIDTLLLRQIWLDVDKDKSNTINSGELGKILNRINFFMKKGDVDKMYQQFAKIMGLDRQERRKGLNFEQVVLILHKIKRDTWNIKPVQTMFLDLFGHIMKNGQPRNRVSSESFLKKFLWQVQGQSNATLEDAQRIFKRLNELEFADVASNLHLDGVQAEKYIDKDRFEAYLISSENDVYDPAAEQFEPSVMNRPLSEYWINSSHNTYLTGDQWQSKSSVEMYMKALHRGCRCVELDCWDGERDADNNPIPIIYHGHTMTSKILFSDVIDTIKVYLNGNPDCFPLILSIENHCSIPYQEIMAECMVSVLKDNLYIIDERTVVDELPSPESLKGKVLIKGRLERTDTIQEVENETSDDESDDEIGIEHGKLRDNDDQPLNPKVKPAKQSSKIAPELARITSFNAIAEKDFHESVKDPVSFMFSFDESKTRRYVKRPHDRLGWLLYNRTHVTRTFPSGKRIDSSNFSPIPGWSTGCQMVALNFQTCDAPMRLNDGRFRENGQCGYVLKPDSLMVENAPPPKRLNVYVKILSGYCLPKPKGVKSGDCISPYIQVSLFDIPLDGGDEIVSNYYTPTVNYNGYSPIWNQQDYFVFKVKNVDVAMLQLTVIDSTDSFIACSSIPVSKIREGIRSVKLYDANNTRSGVFECATLLIEVKLKREGPKINMW